VIHRFISWLHSLVDSFWNFIRGNKPCKETIELDHIREIGAFETVEFGVRTLVYTTFKNIK
jgi:hypothetical protein